MGKSKGLDWDHVTIIEQMAKRDAPQLPARKGGRGRGRGSGSREQALAQGEGGRGRGRGKGRGRGRGRARLSELMEVSEDTAEFTDEEMKGTSRD
eukprot:1153303-Pelagomonas_calceolata.AAC.10